MALIDMIQGLGMDPNQQGLFGLGARLAAAGGATQAPMGMGARMGQAGLGFMQDLQQAQQLAVQKKLREAQLSKLEDELKTAARMSKIRSQAAKMAEESIQLQSDQAVDQSPLGSTEPMQRGAAEGLGQQYMNPKIGLARTLITGGLEGAYGQDSNEMVKMGLGMLGQGGDKRKFESMPMAMRAAGLTTGIPHIDEMSAMAAQKTLDFYRQPLMVPGVQGTTGQPWTYITPHSAAVTGRPGAAGGFPREAPKPLPQEARSAFTGVEGAYTGLDAMEENLKATGTLVKGARGLAGQYVPGFRTKEDFNKFMTARTNFKASLLLMAKGTQTEGDVARIVEQTPNPFLGQTVNKERIRYMRQMTDDLLFDTIAFHKGTGHQIPEHLVALAAQRGMDVNKITPWDQRGKPLEKFLKKYGGKQAPKSAAQPGAATPTTPGEANPEDKRTVGGKNYIKINGQWYEQ